MAEAYIAGAVRTPIGRRNGGLSGVNPVDLAARLVVSEIPGQIGHHFRRSECVQFGDVLIGIRGLDIDQQPLEGFVIGRGNFKRRAARSQPETCSRRAQARRPEGNPKADKRRYFVLGHGSHLTDTARFLGGEITAVHARLREDFGAHCWFVETEFASGALGHLDLIIPIRGDMEEGFQVFGEHGSAQGKVPCIEPAATSSFSTMVSKSFLVVT